MLKELLHPFSIFLLGIILSVLLYYFKKRSPAKVIAILSFAWLILCSLSLITDPLVKNLERRFSVYNPPAQDNNLVRAGNVESNPLWPKVKNMDNLHSVIKEYIAIAAINWRYPAAVEK